MITRPEIFYCPMMKQLVQRELARVVRRAVEIYGTPSKARDVLRCRWPKLKKLLDPSLVFPAAIPGEPIIDISDQMIASLGLEEIEDLIEEALVKASETVPSLDTGLAIAQFDNLEDDSKIQRIKRRIRSKA